jgi:potassium-transporting ATPase potassium-binding subunit
VALEILQIAVVLVVLTVLAVPTGAYIAHIFTGERHLLPERLTYRLLGVDPDEEMNWKRYSVALVLASGAAMLLGYLLLRLQSFLPLNPLGLPPQDPDQAFNSAASFDTTTNWQSYIGEISLSYFNQMAFVTFCRSSPRRPGSPPSLPSPAASRAADSTDSATSGWTWHE